MSRHRSRLEIMLGILSVVRDGKDKPTNIVYATNTSWKRTQIMLSDLVEKDLLEVRTASGKSKRRYAITEKGVNVLDHFEGAKEILPKDVYFDHAR
ncbi:hypothetical protein ES703_78456 [subsurface metagenome]